MSLALRESPAAANALRVGLAALGAAAGTLERHTETPWSSITFSGTRHRLTYRFEGEQAVCHGKSFAGMLPEHLFDIRGQLVADACVTSQDELHRGDDVALTLELELLLLEDA